ncbi:MAG: hypothetical protein Q8O67_09605 [Deltaproteobacteria bacterium]|nr:hypothetical protein [Deltaproteobacteria bacterium]
MKLLVAASALLALSACGRQVGEPLTSSSRARIDPRASGFALATQTVRADGLVLSSPDAPAEPAASLPEPTFEELARAELVATVDFAAQQAQIAGEAGLVRDRFLVENAAVELGNAAALVAQRAQELQMPSADCGCECEVPAPHGDIDNAVVVAAFAAEAAFGIVDELNPPSVVVCTSGGCHDICEEQPGTVDQVALDAAVDDAFLAAEDCAAAGDAVAAL